MSVRAKFRVTEVLANCWTHAVTIKLAPQYDTSIAEDRRYSEATPSGEITLHVSNPPAAAALGLGKYFYVDFTEVPQ